MLEEASRDNLDFLKEKAIRALAQLLQAKPEQEARLLAALVNKLGDPSRKLASNVGHRGPSSRDTMLACISARHRLTRVTLMTLTWLLCSQYPRALHAP